MIKFFRTFRKSLLEEGKTSKYLKYAIGEIILVVIGILIAVQINSLYNQNTQRDTSNRLLKRMVTELEINANRLHYLNDAEYSADIINRLSFTENEKRLNECLFILKEGITYSDIEFLVDNISLSRSNYNLEVSVHEEMINTGNLYKVNSNSLVNDINTYYRLIKREDTYHTELINRATRLLDNCRNWNYFMITYKADKASAISNNPWLFDKQSENYIKLTNYVMFSHQIISRNRGRVSGIIETGNRLISNIQLQLDK